MLTLEVRDERFPNLDHIHFTASTADEAAAATATLLNDDAEATIVVRPVTEDDYGCERCQLWYRERRDI